MTTVRILIVTDEGGGFHRSNTRVFHVGEFVQVLRNTVWEGFGIEITQAHRDGDPEPGTPQDDHPVGADLYDFRFTTASLEGFHVVFFFALADKTEDPVTSDGERQAEAAAVAAFMEAGGGFFATGDHEDLGASICQYIPRVRSMRRWAWPDTGPFGGPLAPGLDEGRHDTLRSGSDSGTFNGVSYAYQFNDQSDDQPQPISPTLYSVYPMRLLRATVPHPLLCSPLGRIDVLPDHMHEGSCEKPANLGLGEGLPGRAGKKEYPADGEGKVVEPEVIAEASMLAHETLNEEFDYVSPMTTERTFGVIAAYDGHRAGIGRVVVDATWHHFININLIGTPSVSADSSKSRGFYTGPGDTPVPAYEKIMWYFRNLVYWLLPANLVQTTTLKQLAQGLRRHPRWEELKGDASRTELGREARLQRVLQFGLVALDFLKGKLGACAGYHALSLLLYPKWRFDPTIWEELGPEIAPWDPATQVIANKLEPVASWRRAFLPDARLRWHVLLGSLAMAVREHIGLYEEVTEKHFARVQRRTLELIPQHLELLAEEMESAVEIMRVGCARLREVVAAMSRGQER